MDFLIRKLLQYDNKTYQKTRYYNREGGVCLQTFSDLGNILAENLGFPVSEWSRT